ncbi:hypothetical protein [Gimesia chilikensis]|uniref:hypothetical protein n=1 Tax=Gimesia chilikensis TaxID=2605989 RepID=UPI00118D250C|nr:hypothetical protein [Gimesia chilikensis]QDT83076.1 hypothetical protein MalM14_07070 [Gimesia chilikensis]
MSEMEIIQALERLLPTEKIMSDARELIEECEYQFDFDEDGLVSIPVDVELIFISKSALYTPYDVHFGTGYKSIVSVGNARQYDLHISDLVADYGFITLWYNRDAKLITTDVMQKLFR